MRPVRFTATYRVTTPMFSGGARPMEDPAELRAASFKGALRFWFRAIAWRELYNLAAVRKMEDVLFGSTRTGQANVLLAIGAVENESVLTRQNLALGSGYLAGQGLAAPDRDHEGRMNTTRSALAPGLRFDVKLLLRGLDEAQERWLRRALITVGLLGGLGARSRRGYGSLTLERLRREAGRGTEELWSPPRDTAALQKAVEGILVESAARERSRGSSEPPYTALSPLSRVLLLPARKGGTAGQMLDDLGAALLHFRSYGRLVEGRRLVGGANALQRFRNDHDHMLNIANLRGGQTSPPPLRAVFGLPHNYYFKSSGTKVYVNPSGLERRASPLLVHVHQVAGAEPVGVVSFLPSTFLPRPELVLKWVKPGEPSRRATARLPPVPVLWEPVHQFLEQLLDPGNSQLCVRFPGAVEVKP